MRKVLVVAVREYQAAVRSKGFIITLVAMPILMGGGLVGQKLLEGRVDLTEKRVAVLDYSGRLFDALARAAEERNESTEVFRVDADGSRRQVGPRFVVEYIASPAEDPLQAQFELSERVRQEGVLGFVIIPETIIQTGKEPAAATIEYYSNRPTYFDFPRWLESEVNRQVQEIRLQSANVDPDLVRAATTPVDVTSLGLVSRDADGRLLQAEETNRAASLLVPVGLMMLMFMVIMIGAQPLLQSVLEEKMQRIAEVLLGSVSPFQLMLGKLLGVVGTSLTITAVYLVGGVGALEGAGFGSLLASDVVWWFVLYSALAVLLYGAVFAAVGAAVTDMKEAQSLIMPVMLVLASPFFIWLHIVREPGSNFALAVSLFPPATPLLMPMRQAVPPGIPLWQPCVGIVLVLLATFLCVFAAGRIFRVGILMQGQGARLGQMLRWIVTG